MKIALFHPRRRRLAVAVAIALMAAVATGIALAVQSDQYVPQLGVTVPAEKVAPIEHAYPSKRGPESTVPAPVPTDKITPIPAALSDDHTSVPLSPSLIGVTNFWIVSNGHRLVAVYAGAAGDDASSGRVVVIRQNLDQGTQMQDVVNAQGTGALRIDNAPLGAAVETSAQTASLHVRSTRGYAGSFDLARDTLSPINTK
jgi:hypothetical protein